jgi:hypothetical protein
MAVEGNATLGYVQGTGTFTATGGGAAVPVVRRGDLNISLWGTFTATVTIERSYDGGSTWLPLTYLDGVALSWTAPMSTAFTVSDAGASYRFNCTAYTPSGTVNWRISQ